MRSGAIGRWWPASVLAVGAVVGVGVAPVTRSLTVDTPAASEPARPAEAGVLERCQWVTGPSCTLGAEAQAVCLMTASCPLGTRVISGACEGFTSVALGRSAPNAESTAWSCVASRVFPIRNPNQIAARALCCP